MREAALATVMNKTMAPSVSAKFKNKPGFNADDYKYEQPAGTQPPSQPFDPEEVKDDSADQCALNRVLSAFLNDKYTKDFIEKCSINKNDFLQFYLVNIAQADVLISWLYENLTTLEMQPAVIFNYCAVIGIEWTSLKDRGPRYYTYKTMKYYFQSIKDEWNVNRMGRNQWQDYSDTDNLWCWFKKWFIENQVAPLIYRRAQLVKQHYRFIEKAIHKADKLYEKFYRPYGAELDDALYTLHKWELSHADAVADKSIEGNDADDSKAAFAPSTAGRYPDEAYDYSEEDDYDDDDDVKYAKDGGYISGKQPRAAGRSKKASGKVQVSPDNFEEEAKAALPSAAVSSASGKVRGSPPGPSSSGANPAGLSDAVVNDVTIDMDLISQMGSTLDPAEEEEESHDSMVLVD